MLPDQSNLGELTKTVYKAYCTVQFILSPCRFKSTWREHALCDVSPLLCLGGVCDGLCEVVAGLAEVGVLGVPLRRDGAQQRPEAGAAVVVLGREVRAPVEGLNQDTRMKQNNAEIKTVDCRQRISKHKHQTGSLSKSAVAVNRV